jgi:hypothetical protein
MLVKQKTQDFIAIYSLTHVLAVDMKGKDMMLRVGAHSSAASTSTDDNATSQWGSGKIHPRNHRNAGKKFRDDMKDFLASKKLAEANASPAGVTIDSPPVADSSTSATTDSSSPPRIVDDSSSGGTRTNSLPPPIADSSSASTNSLPPPIADSSLVHDGRKKQKVVSAAVEVNHFAEVIDAKQFPTLAAKNTCLTSDKDIKAVLRELAKLSKPSCKCCTTMTQQSA